MENENMIDVTEEMDVSEAVNEHDATRKEVKLSSLTDEEAANSIQIRSISSNTYLMDRRGVDWEQTSQPGNLNSIHENQDYIYRILQDLIFTRNDDEESQKFAVGQAMDIVKPFVEEFGIHPEYRNIFPDATANDIALCYCIDAIAILKTILCEIAVYRAKHPVEMSSDVENNNESNQEESL